LFLVKKLLVPFKYQTIQQQKKWKNIIGIELLY
jgi:hypothetical protein